MATTSSSHDTTTASAGHGAALRVDLWLLIFMLGLALVGVGITQVMATGGKLYWLFLVLVYAAISVVRAWQKARISGTGDWSMVRAQALHWLGAIVAINIVLVFESAEISTRGVAADYSLLVLALACYLAGVHFNWGYAILGGMLAVMAVALGYLDQMTLIWVLLPLTLLVIWLLVKHHGRHG